MTGQGKPGRLSFYTEAETPRQAKNDDLFRGTNDRSRQANIVTYWFLKELGKIQINRSS